MFTIRNLGGVALFLFGTTFLWLTPAFVTKGLAAAGAMWSAVQWLSLLTLVGYTAATWGLFSRNEWWETVAITSTVMGVAALIPYWIAAIHAGETNPAFNVLIHAVGAAGVLVLLLVPPLERWVNSHVMAGR